MDNINNRTRRSPELKDKIINFRLSKEMRLPDLVESGYQRKEIEALFSSLEADGIGIYERGQLGRGKSANFICYDKFPENYTLIIKVKRLRQKYTGKPTEAIHEMKIDKDINVNTECPLSALDIAIMGDDCIVQN